MEQMPDGVISSLTEHRLAVFTAASGKSVPTMEMDTTLQQRIAEEVLWDAGVRHAHVAIAVEEGIVTLSGRVDTCAQKLAAQEATHRVSGVLDVASEIQVSPPPSGEQQCCHRSDTEIARDVRQALQRQALLAVPCENIHSSVDGGVVTLQGTVGHFLQRYDTERAVRNLTGVRWVDNRIVVAACQEEDSEDHLLAVPGA